MDAPIAETQAETAVNKKRTLTPDDISVKRSKQDVRCTKCLFDTPNTALMLNHVTCMRTYLETTKLSHGSLQWFMHESTKYHDAEMLRLLFDQKPDTSSFSMNLTESAACHGNIEGIKLTCKHFPWGHAMAYAMSYTLTTNDLSCVNYLRAEGCPIGREFLLQVNIVKHIDKLWFVIKFLEEANYNWATESNTVIQTLLEFGKIDIVEYLRQKGCPWSRYENLLEQFAGKHYHNKEVFLYVYKTKPNWTPCVLYHASKVPGMLEFIYKHCKKDITEEDEAKYYPDRLCVPFNDPAADTVNVCLSCMTRLIVGRVDQYLLDMLQLKDHTVQYCFTCSTKAICYENIWLNVEYKDKFSISN